LQSCDLIRRRTGGNQERALLEPFPGPAQRAPGLVLAGHNPVGIEMKHRHHPFGAGDLLQCRLRTAPGEARRRSADRGFSSRIRCVRFDFTRGNQRPGEPEAEAGCTDGNAMVQRDLTDGFQIAFEHGIGNR
jgi:hypothetical protein